MYDPTRTFAFPHPLYRGQGWDCPREALAELAYHRCGLQACSLEIERRNRGPLDAAIAEVRPLVADADAVFDAAHDRFMAAVRMEVA